MKVRSGKLPFQISGLQKPKLPGMNTWHFSGATGSQGRTEGQVVTKKNVDAISGATPPWGAPDQGWGKGSQSGNNNVVACSKCLLPVAVKSNRKEIPSSYRS